MLQLPITGNYARGISMTQPGCWTRSVLADPYILGVPSGASTGAAATILFGVGATVGASSLTVSAFLGASSPAGTSAWVVRTLEYNDPAIALYRRHGIDLVPGVGAGRGRSAGGDRRGGGPDRPERQRQDDVAADSLRRVDPTSRADHGRREACRVTRPRRGGPPDRRGRPGGRSRAPYHRRRDGPARPLAAALGLPGLHGR